MDEDQIWSYCASFQEITPNRTKDHIFDMIYELESNLMGSIQGSNGYSIPLHLYGVGNQRLTLCSLDDSEAKIEITVVGSVEIFAVSTILVSFLVPPLTYCDEIWKHV